MRKVAASLIVILAAASAALTQDERRITAIRNVYSSTNTRIAEMQQAPELSSVFVIELTVNKHSAPYPAVGIYQRAATFFYTYGDREKNPYPDRLLKIAAVYKRSARTENIDLYFDPAGALIFAFASNPEGTIKETRLYFAAGSLIMMSDDGRNIGLKTQRAAEAGSLARREAARLIGIFRASLVDND